MSGRWSEFVRSMKDGLTQAAFAAKSGIDQATVSRWLKGAQPGRPEQVADLARSHDASVLEAFVAAGYLTEEEAEEGLNNEPDGTSEEGPEAQVT